MEALIIFLAAAALSVAGHYTGMRGIRRGNARMRDIGLLTAIIWAAAAAFIMRSLSDLSTAGLSFGIKKLFKHEGYSRPEFGKVYGTECGAQLVIVPDVEGMESTTRIIERVRNP